MYWPTLPRCAQPSSSAVCSTAVRSVRTNWRFGLAGVDDVREESRYVGAEAIADYRRSREYFSVDGGWRLAERNERQLRLLAGYRYEAFGFQSLPDQPALDVLPDDRTLSYPWIGFDYRQNRFREMTNLTRLQRVEDVRDGFVWRTELGYSGTGLGATEDRVVLNMSFQDSLLATETNYASYGLEQSGTYRLDRMGLVELLPGNRIKLLVSHDFAWQPRGPIQRFFETEVQQDFLKCRFHQPGEMRLFVSGMLSPQSNESVQQKLKRLALEFRHCHEEDLALPLEQRFGVSLLMAMRPWEIDAFASLRRPEARKAYPGVTRN